MEELGTWLTQESHSNPVHVMCVQETQWPTSSEFHDGSWTCVHTGTGTFRGIDITHSELVPGRLLHLRVDSSPAIDLLGTYQHAWNLAKAGFQNQSATPEQLLLDKRQAVWCKIRNWVSGIPKRNQLVILGDLNTTFNTQHPNIGPGVGPPHGYKKDSHTLQALIHTAGLNAINTWSKAGAPSATFLTHTGDGSQIDSIIVRNPCGPSVLKPQVLSHSVLVHPTGFRHLPVQCFLTWPKPPANQVVGKVLTARQVNRACDVHPSLVSDFKKIG